MWKTVALRCGVGRARIHIKKRAVKDGAHSTSVGGCEVLGFDETQGHPVALADGFIAFALDIACT